MTSKDRGHYSKKHSPERKVDPLIAEAVRKRAKEGKLPCAVAFEIVKELEISPDEVGFTLDYLEIKLIKCQMGIFGYVNNKSPVRPLDNVSEEMKEAITHALEGGRLPCRAAWDIAKRLGIRKMVVTAACEKLNVKISSCQLGGF
jgi:hypothetical protein